MVLRTFLGVCVLCVATTDAANAQWALGSPSIYTVQYRPPGTRYVIGRYEHFDLIYEKGVEETAFRIATFLEANVAATDSLIGRGRTRLQMPVIVNGYNDRSNGFVSPVPFRQEIEAPSIKSDALTTSFASWPAGVAPHELVHAAQADLQTGFGVGGLVGLVAPDWGRAINLTAPAGLLEGAAVYRESQLQPGAGRLNAPLATMAYHAAMLSEEPWSLTEMLERPAYTRPFDRHYLGGGQAFAFLAARDESSTAAFFERAARFHHRFPFLGYGVALWYGTRASPHALNTEMQPALIERERTRYEARKPFTPLTTISSAPGLVHRRPHWTSDSTLVVYAEGYNVRAGFYRVDAQSGGRTLISAQRITEDFSASLSRDSSVVYFSRYVPDRWVPRQWHAEVQRLNLRHGEVRQLTEGGRVLAPVEALDGDVWALQNEGAFNQWAIVRADGSVQSITELDRVRFESIAPSPGGSTIAVVLNRDGQQRLYRAVVSDDETPHLVPWLGWSDAAIYDVSWGPKGRYLLFAADPSGVSNVYAFDTQSGGVRRLTNVPFGALEPSLSPDGQTLAFVDYQHERFDLVRMPFQPDAAPRMERATLLRSGDPRWRPPTHAGAVEPPTRLPQETRPYRPVRHLSPRIVYPTFDYDVDGTEESLGVKVGLGVAGVDPLQKWAYSGELFYRADRLWGGVYIQSGAYRLRPSLSLYNRPRGVGAGGLEERGLEFGVGMPITLDANVHVTRARFRFGNVLRQTRIIDGAGDARSAFRTRWTFRPAAAFGYRLQANVRDLVPNHGLAVQSQAVLDAWTTRGKASRGWLSSIRVYLPFLRERNTGMTAYARLLTQNEGAIFNVDTLIPRGYAHQLSAIWTDDRRHWALGPGSFTQLGVEVQQPLTFIDDGFTLVPLYFKALYAYGYAETLRSLSDVGQSLSTAGGGVGVQLRFFYALNLDLRIGAAYRFSDGTARLVYR